MCLSLHNAHHSGHCRVTFTGSGATPFVEFLLILFKSLKFPQVGHLCSDFDETWTQLHEDWGAALFKPVLNVAQTPRKPPDVVPPA